MKKSAIFIIGLCAVAVITLFVVRSPERPVYRKANYQGIDVSNHQGKIDWGKVAQDRNISFVYIKATEGAGFQDKDFRKNWKDAGKSGLRRGAYHFFRSSKDGEVQARNFIRTVGELKYRDLPPVLDIETIHIGCSKELLNQRALQWLKAVEKRYGKKPVVYASSSFVKDNLCKEITSNYPIWVAHYEKDRPGLEDWTWWQFTDKAVVKGVPGRVDLSVMKAD